MDDDERQWMVKHRPRLMEPCYDQKLEFDNIIGMRRRESANKNQRHPQKEKKKMRRISHHHHHYQYYHPFPYYYFCFFLWVASSCSSTSSSLRILALQMPPPSSGSRHFHKNSNTNASPSSSSSSSSSSSTQEEIMTTSQPIFSQGLDTYRVPMSLHEENRSRLLESLKKANKGSTSRGIILLQGGKQTPRYDTDHEPLFRQESFFHWTFGVAELEGCYGTIDVQNNNDDGKTTLFLPQYGIDYEIFCGQSPPFDDVKAQYGVDEVLSIDDLADFVKDRIQENDENKLFLLSGMNTDSGKYAIPAEYDGMDRIDSTKKDMTTLFECIVSCRVYKSTEEIDLMRYTHYLSSMAHVEVMRTAKPGMMEYQLESLFMHYTYSQGGMRFMSYTCICACGPNPSILHYGHSGRPNNRLLQDGDMALLDMGAEYHCYASDITCSFPINGKFTDDQQLIYQAVLDAQIAVIQAVKPGIQWTDMHRLAERTMLQALIKGGLLKDGFTLKEMIDADLGAMFFPCGLGHFIGLDTHDVGGYTKGSPPRSTRPGLNKLRTARVLEEGMVITVEPGYLFH